MGFRTFKVGTSKAFEAGQNETLDFNFLGNLGHCMAPIDIADTFMSFMMYFSLTCDSYSRENIRCMVRRLTFKLAVQGPGGVPRGGGGHHQPLPARQPRRAPHGPRGVRRHLPQPFSPEFHGARFAFLIIVRIIHLSIFAQFSFSYVLRPICLCTYLPYHLSIFLPPHLSIYLFIYRLST